MPNHDAEQLERDLRALAEGLQQQSTLEELGLGQKKKITDRTAEGLDYLGDEFTAYQSDRWKKEREKKELPTDKVNLEFNLYDGMLTYLSTEVDLQEGDVTVGIFDEQKALVAEGHNTGANHLPKRQFMGVSEKDTKDLAQLMGQEVEQLLEKLDLDT